MAGLALARRVGHRDWEWQFIGQMFPQAALGEWDDVQDGRGLPFEAIGDNRIAYNGFLAPSPPSTCAEASSPRRRRHMPSSATRILRRRAGAVDRRSGRAIIARAEGRYDDALRHAREALDARVELGIGHEAMKDSVVEGSRRRCSGPIR